VVVAGQTDSLEMCYEREDADWGLAITRLVLECMSILAPPFVLVLVFYIELRWHFTAPDVVLVEDMDIGMGTASPLSSSSMSTSHGGEQRLIAPSSSGLHERSLLSLIDAGLDRDNDDHNGRGVSSPTTKPLSHHSRHNMDEEEPREQFMNPLPLLSTSPSPPPPPPTGQMSGGDDVDRVDLV
jgi:hypothetical protein